MSAVVLADAVIGIATLLALSYIDLRTRLLPNPLTLLLALTGLGFHLATQFHVLNLSLIVQGGLYGFLSLYLLRAASNHLAQADTLGLGDVKLMGAGGLWLGPSGIMAAMAVGAAASLVFGFLFTLYRRIARGERIPLGSFTLPAGPGFALGLVVVAAVGYHRSVA